MVRNQVKNQGDKPTLQTASALSLAGPVTFLTGDRQLCKVPGLKVHLVS